MENTLLIGQILSTTFMCGLIYLIQFVHYPSFSYVDKVHYRSFQLFHMRRITPIVMSAMVIELVSAIFLFYLNNNLHYLYLLILTGLIWLNTFLWNIPIHNKLTKQYDLKNIKKLIISNYPRTILWSMKIYIIIVILEKKFIKG